MASQTAVRMVTNYTLDQLNCTKNKGEILTSIAKFTLKNHSYGFLHLVKYTDIALEPLVRNMKVKQLSNNSLKSRFA